MPGGRAGAVAAVAVLIAAPFLFWNLGGPPFDDPGEGMHAEIARELVASGDPFALSLSGVRYVDKPPLLYGLIALASGVAGPGEGAARSPSATAALAAVGATAWLGARLLGWPGGILAGVALLSSIGFFAYGRYVRPETLLVSVLIGGFALVLTGIADDRRGRVIAGMIVFGLAALAKDPVAALAPPLAIAIAVTLTGRTRPHDRWLPAAGVVGLLVVAFGWWALAETRTPGFVWYTVVDNHLLNVARVRYFPDEDVPLSALEFLTVAALGAAPWSLAAAASVVELARSGAWRRRPSTAWVALAVWAVGVLALTAASPFRLPHYGLPAYPMLALLAARAWQSRAVRWLLPAHVVGFGLVGAGAALMWSGAGPDVLSRVLGATDVATRKGARTGAAASLPAPEAFASLLGWTAAIFGLAALALIVVWTIDTARRPALAAALVAVAMLALLPVIAAALGLVSAHRSVRPLAIEVRDRWRPGDVLVHEGPLENSGALEWYAGRRPVMVDGRRSVLGFGAMRTEASDAFWDGERLAAMWGGGSRVWLVTTRDAATTIAARLPFARLVAVAGGRRLYVNRAAD